MKDGLDCGTGATTVRTYLPSEVIFLLADNVIIPTLVNCKSPT